MLFVKPIEDGRFVADDPAIMAWRNIDNIAGVELQFLPIIGFHMHGSGGQETDMMHLAGNGFRRGFHIFRPLPARLIRVLQNHHVTKFHGIYPLFWKRLRLIRLLKILFSQNQLLAPQLG